MDFQDIIYDARDGIARITLNHPETLNAHHERLVQEVIAAIDLARQDDAVRVLILTGTGRGFCSGGDISGSAHSRSRFAGHPMEHLLEMRENMHQLVMSLHRF